MIAQPKSRIGLIAPCGMNCSICRAYLRDKKKCPGCRGSDKEKSISCVRCQIKNCTKRSGKYCYSCVDYPCARLKHLDKRYRTKYYMSMVDNLNNLKKVGIIAFAKNEIKRWTCLKCQGTICVHGGVCFECGNKRVYNTKYK